MGAGPEHFLELGFDKNLEAASCAVTVERIEAQAGFWTEIRTSFELYRSLSRRVSAATQSGAFPLTIAGNCSSALGTVSGVGIGDIGVVWFDAHGDFNTPETSTGGYFDGMGLASLTGACWRGIASTIPGFRAIPGDHVVHIGARDLDLGEEARMQEAGLAVVNAMSIAQLGAQAALERPLKALAERVRTVYLHLDLDVFSPRAVPANEYQPAGGITISQAVEAVRLIQRRFNIVAGAVTAYDPAYDPDDRAIPAVSRIMELLLAAYKDRS